MKTAIFAASVFSALFALNCPSSQAEETGKLSLDVGMHYNTGKYGGIQSTDILYIPVTAKYKGKTWVVRVTLPYLQITGPGNVINGVGQTAIANNQRTTRSGMGDIVLSATRNVYKNDTGDFAANLTGKIKLGTADSAKGLGTGMNDYALQAELFQRLGDLTAFATGGYKIHGSPPGVTIYNVFYGTLGGSYKFSSNTNGGAMLKAGQKTTLYGSPHQEAIIFVDHKIKEALKVQMYILKGFTNSVPDAGAGITVGYTF